MNYFRIKKIFFQKRSDILKNAELVYFVFPSCDGNCSHCWSSDMMLGRYKPIEWHKRIIEKLSEIGSYSVIKLSGGEPFFNHNIGKIAKYIHNVIGENVPIQIFTSGRPFVSLNPAPEGIQETKRKLCEYINDFNNISIQLSIDEFHLKVLQQKSTAHIADDNLIRNYINNFMATCFELMKEHPMFLGPKLKIHCQLGRREYHQKLFSWFPFEWWDNYVIITEGLVYSGNAKNLNYSFEIQETDQVSYFFLPGVDFYEQSITKNAVEFYKEQNKIYLDDSENSGILFRGWWSIIKRKADYQKIEI